MKDKWALVSDFDGTISDDDFFWFVVERYLGPEDLEPWNRYLRGEISHLDAMRGVFSRIHIPEAELLSFIDTIRVDKEFAKAAEFCSRRGIPVYISSAGSDYYIRRLIGGIIDDYGIHLVTNHGVYSPEKGVDLFPPRDGPFYDPDIGISKAGVVRALQQQGYKVVLAGDGPPDFAPAQLAEVVFAKKFLLEKCREANIKTQPFATFGDVLKYLKEV